MRGLAKAASGPGSMQLQDVSRPEPSSDEVLVEVAYAGLCGSDAGIYAFKDAYHGMDLPTIIGHEYSGRVVSVGSNVDGVEAGDHVVERPIRACGDCYQCRSGTPNVCRDARITGVHHDGAYAEYVAVPKSAVHELPPELDLRRAAITEPTSVAARAVIRNSRVAPGDRVLVEGPGPIGQLAAQIADAQGGDVVVSGVERDSSHRLPLASELGFETVDVESEDLSEFAEATTDGTGFDVVVDTTGHPSGFHAGTDVVRKGGQIVAVGLPGQVETDFTDLVRAEIDVQCSYASTWEDFERAIRMLESGAVDAETLVDTRFSLLDGDAAFESFLDGQTCKPVFDVSELRA